MSSQAIGKFAGPAVGGIVVERFGFRQATLLFFVVYCITLSLNCFAAINLAGKVKYPLQSQNAVGESTDTERLITKNWIDFAVYYQIFVYKYYKIFI